MKGTPPHELVSLSAGVSGNRHIRCPGCGYDLYGTITSSYFRTSNNENATTPTVICPECGTKSLYTGELEGIEVDQTSPIPVGFAPRIASPSRRRVGHSLRQNALYFGLALLLLLIFYLLLGR